MALPSRLLDLVKPESLKIDVAVLIAIQLDLIIAASVFRSSGLQLFCRDRGLLFINGPYGLYAY